MCGNRLCVNFTCRCDNKHQIECGVVVSLLFINFRDVVGPKENHAYMTLGFYFMIAAMRKSYVSHRRALMSRFRFCFIFTFENI